MAVDPAHDDTILRGQRVAFIGGGVMAEAMVSSLRARHADQSILVTDIAEARRQHLHARYGVEISADNHAATAADVLVLCVKPQHLPALMTELGGRIDPDTLVLSIIAGARLAVLSAGLRHAAIVRAMPNTPARIGQGSTVWIASSSVGAQQLARARALLSVTGLELEVASEDYVEMATGLSGPMPAFVFLVMEALVEGGVKLGLPRELASALTRQTFAGSVALLQHSGEEPAALRQQVTSPGGATAAGLAILDEAGVRAAFSDAVHAVYARALALVPGETPKR